MVLLMTEIYYALNINVNKVYVNFTNCDGTIRIVII